MSSNRITASIAKEALTGFRFVELNSADQKVDMADSIGSQAFGVVVADHAAEATCQVVVEGFVSVDFAEAADAGDEITTDASGKAILADTTGHNILGYYCPLPYNGAPPSIASGERGRIYLYGNKNSLVP
jgi:hypothetical protein